MDSLTRCTAVTHPRPPAMIQLGVWPGELGASPQYTLSRSTAVTHPRPPAMI